MNPLIPILSILSTEIHKSLKRLLIFSASDIANKILHIFPSILLDKNKDYLILKYIDSDKKNSSGSRNFTLIKNIGHSIVNCSVSDKDVLSSLDFYRKNVQINIK